MKCKCRCAVCVCLRLINKLYSCARIKHNLCVCVFVSVSLLYVWSYVDLLLSGLTQNIWHTNTNLISPVLVYVYVFLYQNHDGFKCGDSTNADQTLRVFMVCVFGVCKVSFGRFNRGGVFPFCSNRLQSLTTRISVNAYV